MVAGYREIIFNILLNNLAMFSRKHKVHGYTVAIWKWRVSGTAAFNIAYFDLTNGE